MESVIIEKTRNNSGGEGGKTTQQITSKSIPVMMCQKTECTALAGANRLFSFYGHACTDVAHIHHQAMGRYGP